MNWKKILINIGVTAGSAFLGIYSQGGSVKTAGVGALVTAVANVAGLAQKQPTASATPEAESK